MGKAYTEKEREKIHTQLLEAGLELFHEGVRKISIRELAKRAGIAQGGFYTFFSDKDDFVMELICYRNKQKMKLIEKQFDLSLENPVFFVSETIFRTSWDLKQKAEKSQMYADIFRFCIDKELPEREKLYAQVNTVLQHLSDYWEKHDLPITLDIKGIINVIKGTLILYSNLDLIDEQYAQVLLKTFISENCKRYIRKIDEVR